MKNLIIVFVLVMSQTINGEEWRHKWDQSGSTWSEKWTITLDSIQSFPRDEQIEMLGSASKAKIKYGGQNPTENQLAVANRAINLLIAIPGHAEYYRDMVDQANDVRKAAIPDARAHDDGAIDHGVKLLKFMNARDEAFRVLRNVPSPETVRVLGHYLEDEWVSPLPFDKPHWFEKPLASHAAEALGGLPLVNKPVKIRIPPDRGDPEMELKAWQHWYEQIKSGKRTFRFEGDPQEYDLDGPVPKAKLVSIERDRKRDEERASRSSKSGSGAVGEFDRITSSPGSTAGIVAAVLGIMAAGWYYWRKRIQKA